MTTVIIEDEPLVAKDLQNLLLKIDPSIQVSAMLDSLHSSINYFNKNTLPDLIFMDIQLSDGVCFEIFKHVQITCPIIFTTAYNEYAIRAFKVNSIAYLLKPVDKSELIQALEKFRLTQENAELSFKKQLQTLIGQFNLPVGSKIYKERFTVRVGKSYTIIHETEIASFHKDALIYIITKDNQKYVTDFQTMDEIEDLVDPRLFFRANRQIIINSASINNFRSDVYGKLIVTLKPPVTLQVDISREKAQAFKGWIE